MSSLTEEENYSMQRLVVLKLPPPPPPIISTQPCVTTCQLVEACRVIGCWGGSDTVYVRD
jgi:hypothetical protein